MREYHIDMHRCLSVRKPAHVRPKVIMGQDESAIKQYSFSNTCWYNHQGSTKLRPKTDGIAIMLSAVVSRMFVMGLPLNEIELGEINERRMSHKWKHYMSAESALEVHGTTLKKPLTSKHALIEYFDLGMQNDGYWGYHHMALQCEDVLEILSVKYPHCDFVLLMDHSTGHMRKRKDGLDAKQLGKYWGGK